MANLKIIWTTGKPFSPASVNKIGYQISSDEFNIYIGSFWTNQSSSLGKGYRPATAEEIAEHWKVLHPKWTPEPGDRVIVTQDIGTWCNKRGTIVNADGSEYWIVKRDDDGRICTFMKENQMILAPYEDSVKPVEATETSEATSPESKHGFTIGDIVIPDSDNFKGRECIVRALGSASVGVHCPLGAALGGHTLDGHCPDNTGRWYSPSSLKLVSKVEPETVSKPSTLSTPTTPSIPPPKEGYVTVRLFTEEEFKSKGLWDTYGGKGYPKGWNMDGEMNKYLNTYLQISESGFRRDKSFTYSGWNFKDTDYEVIHEGVEPKPEPKEPEMKPQRFKVGDQVTYKSKSSCNGYRYGGNDHDGYVGTITSYLSYYSGNECYGIHVTSREGEYTMLECEFHEYDGTYPGAVTLGTSAGSDLRIISAGTANTTFLGTVGLQIVQTVPKPKDDLAKYDQAPVTLHKKPKTKLITVNTY